MNGNAIIFLDGGHYNGGNTGMGELEVPLYQELDQIINNFKDAAIIIIDDFRLFGYNKEGWDIINLKTIIEICESRLIKKYNLESSMDPEDRLILHIKSL